MQVFLAAVGVVVSVFGAILWGGQEGQEMWWLFFVGFGAINFAIFLNELFPRR